jgi:glycosyltransferase involved in cell wall biosynthesis
MKILLAVHHFPPRYTAGAEWQAYRIAQALQKRGHQVRVVTVERIDSGRDGKLSWQDDLYEGVQVQRLSFDLNASPDKNRWEYDNPLIADHLQQVITEWAPDVFHITGGYLISGSALRTAKEMDIPTVLSLTDFWFICRRVQMLRSDGSISTLPINVTTCARCLAEENRRFRIPAMVAPGLMDIFWKTQSHRAVPIQERLDFLLATLNEVDVIIAPSQFMKRVYLQAGVAPDRMIYSRQGHDFSHLNPGLLNKTSSSRLRIGYLGQITWLKGVHVLFDALAQSPDLPVDVKVYGDETHFPDYAGNLRRAASKDGRIEFCGLFRRQEISSVFQNIDALVVPSLWYENSPNVILEAFAHQTPVVATNLGGMAELVRHEKNGLLFEPGNAGSLAVQLRRLVAEKELLEKLKTGIPAIRSTSDEIDELEEIFQRLILEKRNTEERFK